MSAAACDAASPASRCGGGPPRVMHSWPRRTPGSRLSRPAEADWQRAFAQRPSASRGFDPDRSRRARRWPPWRRRPSTKRSRARARVPTTVHPRRPTIASSLPDHGRRPSPRAIPGAQLEVDRGCRTRPLGRRRRLTCSRHILDHLKRGRRRRRRPRHEPRPSDALISPSSERDRRARPHRAGAHAAANRAFTSEALLRARGRRGSSAGTGAAIALRRTRCPSRAISCPWNFCGMPLPPGARKTTPWCASSTTWCPTTVVSR